MHSHVLCSSVARVTIPRLLFCASVITCSKVGVSEGGTDVASHAYRMGARGSTTVLQEGIATIIRNMAYQYTLIQHSSF